MLLAQQKGFLSDKSGHESLNIVPLLDLIRFQKKARVDWSYNEGKNGLEIKATTDIAEGDQLFFSYADKPN